MITDDELDRRVRDHLDSHVWTTPPPGADILTRRVSQRAQRRRVTVGALATAIPVCVILIGLTMVGGPRRGDGAGPAARTPLVGVTAGPVPSCGQTVGDPALQGTLALRAAPLTVSANGPGLVSYDTKLVNGTSTSLAGVLGPVESVVVRDGIVVAAFDGGRQVGQVIDLTPGSSLTLPGSLSLINCAESASTDAADKSAQSLPGVSLPAGSYTVHSRVTLIRADGNEIALRSDPWQVVIA